MKIAIVEDKKQHSEALKSYLTRYGEEKGVFFDVHSFSDGLKFLEGYNSSFDIVFMDVEMPHINGIETAKRLREIDRSVCLIFVTEFSQFAINGYEVEAFDFIAKPVEYEKFSARLAKAIDAVNQKGNATICIKNRDLIRIVKINDICYIENRNHKIVYHLINEEIETWDSLDNVEKLLPPDRFARCSTSYLVNFSYVISIKGNEVFLPNARLSITRLKKKEFLNKFIHFSTN